MREEINSLKKQLEEVKNESLAMELLREAKKTNRRTFIMWIITFIFMIFLVGYVIYLKCDDITTTSEITIDEVEKIDNSTIKIGDDIWEKLQ